MLLPDELSVEPGPRFPRTLRVGLALLGVGLAVAVGCGAWVATRAVPVLTDGWTTQELATPFTGKVALAPGDYVVYECTSEPVTVGDVTAMQSAAATMTVENVRVAGPGGAAVDVRPPLPMADPLDREGVTFSPVAVFTVPREATYTVVATAAEPAEVVLTRSTGSAFAGLTPWLAGTGAGVTVALVGVLVLVVGAVRGFDHRPLRSLPPPVGPAPPGWYGDPRHPDTVRYWDGDVWTDRTR